MGMCMKFRPFVCWHGGSRGCRALHAHRARDVASGGGLSHVPPRRRRGFVRPGSAERGSRPDEPCRRRTATSHDPRTRGASCARGRSSARRGLLHGAAILPAHQAGRHRKGLNVRGQSRSLDGSVYGGPARGSLRLRQPGVRADTRLRQGRRAAGDPKRWFTRVYEYVTECQLTACRERAITHRAWVLRLIPSFHDYYTTSLSRVMGTASGSAEVHWRDAFAAMAGGSLRYRAPGDVLAYGLLRGVRAHIEEDLPRALAEVYAQHYRGRCS